MLRNLNSYLRNNKISLYLSNSFSICNNYLSFNSNLRSKFVVQKNINGIKSFILAGKKINLFNQQKRDYSEKNYSNKKSQHDNITNKDRNSNNFSRNKDSRFSKSPRNNEYNNSKDLSSRKYFNNENFKSPNQTYYDEKSYNRSRYNSEKNPSEFNDFNNKNYEQHDISNRNYYKKNTDIKDLAEIGQSTPRKKFDNSQFQENDYYMNMNVPDTFSNKLSSIKDVKDPLQREKVKSDRFALSFRQFAFLSQIYSILDKLEINSPTSIQNMTIPKILEKKNVFFASQTGMGKTLTYVLPILNELKLQELQINQRLTLPKRPRVLILAPSRELCQQIEEVIKIFVYDLPLVVESFYVGKPFNTEKKYSISGIDILISTPDRFRNHWGKNNVYITKITHLIIDELDTFLDAGYADFIQDLSLKLLKIDKQYEEKNKEIEADEQEIDFNVNYEQNKRIQANNFKENNTKQEKEDQNANLKDNSVVNSMEKIKPAQIIFVSTTLTNAIDLFIEGIFYEEIYKKQKRFSGEGNFVKIIDKSTNHNLSNIKHEFLQVTDYDKYPTLLKILNDNKKILKQNFSIILFVNSIMCARKTELFLAENGYQTCCLHGEIPPLRRKFELDKFKKRQSKILVTTDLIARGLDFPFVYLVINFDFPHTISDYIHRAGRTGRAGRKGFVISFFRKHNKDLIEDIKKSNQNNTPLMIDGSMFSKKNKENMNRLQGNIKKRLTHGVNKKLSSLSNGTKNEKISALEKLRKRKEKIDAVKAKIISERKERIKIIDRKHNRRYRQTNKNNSYGRKFSSSKKK